MSDDKVISLKPKLEARKVASIDLQSRLDRSAEHFRIICRAVREVREKGASTAEIVHALEAIASELQGGGNRPA